MKILRAAVAAALISAAAVPAATGQEKDDGFPGSFSANVAITTDYRFRGISQTKDVPALQGGLDWEYAITKYLTLNLGVWGSNVDFADGDQAQVEFDFYGGVGGSVGKFSWKLQFIYYYYPGAATRLNYDFFEVAPSIGYDFGFMSATVGVNVSPDYFGASGTGVYVYGDVAVPLPIPSLKEYKPTLEGHVGYQSIRRNAAFGTPDYWDWSVGVSAEVKGFGLSLKYVDTGLSRARCFGGASLCGPTAIFTVSRSF